MSIDRDITSYITGRFAKLERAARETKESAIKLAVAVHTQCAEPAYSRVLDRMLASYSEVPSERINEVVRRITAEEVRRANAE